MYFFNLRFKKVLFLRLIKAINHHQPNNLCHPTTQFIFWIDNIYKKKDSVCYINSEYKVVLFSNLVNKTPVVTTDRIYIYIYNSVKRTMIWKASVSNYQRDGTPRLCSTSDYWFVWPHTVFIARRPNWRRKNKKKKEKKSQNQDLEDGTRSQMVGSVCFFRPCFCIIASGANTTLPDPSRSPQFRRTQQILHAFDASCLIWTTLFDGILWSTGCLGFPPLSRKTGRVWSIFASLSFFFPARCYTPRYFTVVRPVRSTSCLTNYPPRLVVALSFLDRLFTYRIDTSIYSQIHVYMHQHRWHVHTHISHSQLSCHKCLVLQRNKKVCMTE